MAGKEAVKARSGGTKKKAEAPIRDPGPVESLRSGRHALL